MSTSRKGSVRYRHGRRCRNAQMCRRRCGGAWQFRARTPSGDRIERSGFATAADAERALRELLGEVDRGTFHRIEQVGFREFAEAWLEVKKPDLRPATYTDYEGTLRNHLIPYFGDAALTSIRRDWIDRYRADKDSARKPDGSRAWSPKSINNSLSTLRQVLDYAVETGRLTANPGAGVRRLKLPPRERTAMEPEALLRAFDAAGDPWRLMFRMATLTGMRRGEILGARWVDLREGRLHVRQTYGVHGFGEPKSAAGRRTVPLPTGLLADLEERRQTVPPNPHGLIFATRTGNPIGPRNFHRAWKLTLERAGLDPVPLHQLRHTAASLFRRHEALDLKQLSTVIGHSDPAFTLRVYSHLFEDELAGFGNETERALNAAAGDAAGDTAPDSVPSEWVAAGKRPA